MAFPLIPTLTAILGASKSQQGQKASSLISAVRGIQHSALTAKETGNKDL